MLSYDLYWILSLCILYIFLFGMNILFILMHILLFFLNMIMLHIILVYIIFLIFLFVIYVFIKILMLIMIKPVLCCIMELLNTFIRRIHCFSIHNICNYLNKHRNTIIFRICALLGCFSLIFIITLWWWWKFWSVICCNWTLLFNFGVWSVVL